MAVGGAEDGLYTYDIPLVDGGPRVPDAGDLGGVEIEDNFPPPTKGAQRHANMDNVQTQTLAGLVRMGPTCRVSVEYSSGWLVARVDAMGTLVDASMFDFTANGTGDVTVFWADGTLPPQGGKPRVWCPDSDAYGRGTSGVNEVRVFVKLQATDGPVNNAFVLEIFG